VGYVIDMSMARKILSNTFIQIGGKIVGALISVVIVKLITNFLSVEGYGQYVSVYEFLAFFGIIADLGLFTIAVREMAKNEQPPEFILGNILSMRTLFSLGAMGLAILVAFIVPQYQGTYIPIGVAIASISVFFSILNGTVSSVLQIHLKMQYPTIALVVGKIVSVGYMIYVILVAFQAPSAEAFYQLLWAGVAGNFLMLVITWFYAAKYAKIQFLFDFYYWRNTLVKALPYGIALILNMIYFRFDSILLLLLKDSREVAYYGVPMRILDILSIIPVYFMNSVLPVLTICIKENVQKAQQIVQHCFDFMLSLAVPIVVGAQVLAYPLIFIISSPDYLSRLGDGFYGSDIALRILIVAMAFSFISSIFTFSLISIGNQGKLLFISLGGAVVNLACNFIVIPRFGFLGAAFTSVLSEAFILTFAFLMLRQYFPLKLHFGAAFKILFSALIMGVVVWVLRDPLYGLIENFNFLVLLPLGVAVYGFMLWATGVINKERLALLRGK